MDPADADTVRSALTAQGTKLQHQETKLNTISVGVQQLTDRQVELQMEVATQVNRLTTQLQLVVNRLEGLALPTPATPAPAQLSVSSALTFTPRFALLAWPHRRNSRESPREMRPEHYSTSNKETGRVVDYAVEFRTLVADSEVGRCGDPRRLCQWTHGGDQGSPSTDGVAR
ncbi:hypothetical protein L3Q82_020353 [Scortum barcoo]|uniref:Uncharacterized protein n=1 Tax=Scortum barcoo TaxID=214431 RepID=A0ACB8V7L5_9TELE|nr:hypothetical protein L3Q82_020353 [Scortum barcoo]